MRRLLGASSICGLLASLYVAGGRWSFERLGGEAAAAGGALFQVRTWAIAGLVALACFPRRGRGPAAGAPAHRDVSCLAATAALFLLYVTVSCLWSPRFDAALAKAIDAAWMLAATTALSRALFVGDPERARAWFWRYTTLLTALLALAAVAAMLAQGPGRLAAFGGGPIVFGRLMGYLALGCLFFFRRGGNLLWAVPAGAAVVLAAASGSRGAVGALAVAFIALALHGRGGFKAGAAAAAAAVALAFLAASYSEAGRETLSFFQRRLFDPVTGGVYLSLRQELFAAGLDLALEHPLAGAGLGAFDYKGVHSYPHNLLLEVLSEGGVTGLALLLLPFAAFVYLARGRWRTLDEVTVAALVLILAASQTSGDLYDARAAFILLLLAAVPRERAGETPPAA